jgi:DNA-binding CsgD family transcriptional regulator
VPDQHPLILDRAAELAVVSGAARAAAAGRGALILLQGPAGIGRTTVLRAACAAAAAPGLRTLSAAGFALEQEFSYGIVRQLLEPVRAAAGQAEWDTLTEGAARPARLLLDGPGPGRAEPGPAADDPAHATLHGLYRLTADLAARTPLLLAVDDAHWADAASLRWLSHLAARVESLPLLLLLAVRSGPGQPDVLSALRGYPACAVLELPALGRDASAALVRDRLGGQAGPVLCRAAHTVTRGNPFLLDALAREIRARGLGGPGGEPDEAAVVSIGPRPVADAAARRIGSLGEDAVALTRALAVLGRPAPLRQVAVLAGLDLPRAALLTDRLRAASMLGPGTLLEFEHPVERTAIYDSIPPGERALAHARMADLLDADGAGPELIALHLLGSEPAADARAVTVLRAAAVSAAGRGAPAAAAGFLRRALAEPPRAADRAGLLLDLGLTLARDRDQEAVTVLGDAVAQAGNAGRPGAALLSAGALGIWGHHDRAAQIARSGLAASGADPIAAEQLEAELLANSWRHAVTARSAWERAGRWLTPGPGPRPPGDRGLTDWPVYRALSATLAARRGSAATALLAPALTGGPAVLRPDSPAAVTALLVLTWNDELEQALAYGDGLLADAEARGSLNLATAVRGPRSLILRRLGRLQEAAADARAGFDFGLQTSPPVEVAWSAAFLVEALTRLGRFDEAEEAAAAAQQRRPPDGWIHSIMLAQARGALRVAEQRYADGLAELRTVAEGWRTLDVSSPAVAYWRVPAVTACAALDREQEAARLAAEQLELARAVGTPVTLGVSLRIAAPFAPDPERALSEAITLLTAGDGQYEQGLARADLGAYRRRTGRRTEAREPLRLALDYAERAGAEQLRGYARAELLAVGARPRRTALTGPEALTGAERQVAALAAAGRSNRQIAQQLFIAQATVETHLRHAFHKLGITSRTDLPERLTEPTCR